MTIFRKINPEIVGSVLVSAIAFVGGAIDRLTGKARSAQVNHFLFATTM